jgi:hypothetical protein
MLHRGANAGKRQIRPRIAAHVAVHFTVPIVNHSLEFGWQPLVSLPRIHSSFLSRRSRALIACRL